MDGDLKQRLARWLRPEIAALKAYHVPDARGLIKLDAMENPYGLPPSLRDAWLAQLRDVAVNRYPDPQAATIRSRLRAQLQLADDYEIVFGNGSDELIQIVLAAFAGHGRSVLAPVPTFVMYEQLARIVGLEFNAVELREDFSLDLPATLEAIARLQPALVFIAYPNNPTGNAFARDDIEAVVRASPGIVIIDEAYRAFADSDAMDLLTRYEHVGIMRTFSKEGMAGLRLGYLIVRTAAATAFDKIRLPYNINALTQASIAFALDHAAVFAQQAQEIRRERTGLFAALNRLPGVIAYPSATNFVLFRLTATDANQVHAALRTRGVLIKNLHGAHPRLAHCLRVTVGTPAENTAFLTALRATIAPDISAAP